MDFKDLASRLGIDEEEFLELVELFVTVSRSDMEKINKGVRGHNPAEASAAAHSIKGAAANLGFDEISSLALDMEMQAKEGNLEGFDARLSSLDRMLTDLDIS